MDTILLSVPSGSHSRALLKPLRPYFEKGVKERKLKLIIVSPLSHYPELTEEFVNSGFIFVSWDPEIFNKFQPDITVSTTTGLDEYDIPILEEAKKRNIPTLTYVESWDNIYKMERRKEEMIKIDTLLVWNKMNKKHIMKTFGYQNNQVHCVGSPRLDYFWHKDKMPSRRELFKYLDIEPNKKLIHLATVELYDISYVVKILAQARDKGQLAYPLEIYCSVHPGGDIKKHKWYAQRYNVKLRYSFGRKDNAPHPSFRYNPTEEDMYRLTSLWTHSDLMINFSSTAAIESMLGDTPTINIMFPKPFDLINWRKSAVYRDFKEHYKDIIKEKGTTVVKNKKQLLKSVNQYLENPSLNHKARRKTCKKMLTYLDGKCSERVFNYIINY